MKLLAGIASKVNAMSDAKTDMSVFGSAEESDKGKKKQPGSSLGGYNDEKMTSMQVDLDELKEAV